MISPTLPLARRGEVRWRSERLGCEVVVVWERDERGEPVVVETYREMVEDVALTASEVATVLDQVRR